MVSHPLDSRRVLKGPRAGAEVAALLPVSHPLDSRRVLKVLKIEKKERKVKVSHPLDSRRVLKV